jgi:hypothetical protein
MADINGNHRWLHPDSERKLSVAERFLSYVKRLCPYLT